MLSRLAEGAKCRVVRLFSSAQQRQYLCWIDQRSKTAVGFAPERTGLVDKGPSSRKTQELYCRRKRSRGEGVGTVLQVRFRQGVCWKAVLEVRGTDGIAIMDGCRGPSTGAYLGPSLCSGFRQRAPATLTPAKRLNLRAQTPAKRLKVLRPTWIRTFVRWRKTTVQCSITTVRCWKVSFRDGGA